MGPFGSKITKENYVENGVPLIRGNNLARGIFLDEDFVFITEEKADDILPANVSPGDIIFTHRGTIGQVTMVTRSPKHDRYAIGSSQVKTRLDESIALPEFYYYWFHSPQGQRSILANTSTVGVPGIATPLTSIRKLKVPKPSLDEQKAIAATLGALDDKIAVNERIVSTLSELSSATFRDSQPKQMVLVSDISQVTMGQSPPGDTYNETTEGLPFYQGTKDFGFRFPGKRVWCTAATRRASAKDVLVSIRAPVGTINVATEECGIGRGLTAVRSTTHPHTLLQALSADNSIWMPYEKEGTVFGSINKKQFSKLEIPWPEDSSLDEIEERLQSLDDLLAQYTAESRTLTELRDTLLPQLMSGKLRVKDAEKIVEDNV